jgi:YVTN family beta-propeller protein
MDTRKLARGRTRAALVAAFAACAGLAGCGGGNGYGGDNNAPPPPPAPPPAAAAAAGPQSSGPIQISSDDKTVWVANPETDTVTALNVAGDAKEKLAEVPVGKEPRNLAISPDGKRVFVANAGEDTLTVLDATAKPFAKLGTVKVGIEPYGLAFTPNGSKLYVANARSNTVSVVDPASLQVLRTITGVGQEPRGVAVTNNGDANDDDEKVYVTQFFGVDRAGAVIGADDYKEGHVASSPQPPTR